MSATPLLGALIADQYLRRYNTLQYSNIFTLVSHITLVIAALPSIITYPKAALAAFVLGSVLIGIGFGGYRCVIFHRTDMIHWQVCRPNLVTLLAEQVPKRKLRLRVDEKGNKTIVDSATTRTRVFLYFSCVINIGSIAGMTSMVYAEKYVGFWLSFTITTAVFSIGLLFLFTHRKKYITTPPVGLVPGKAYGLCALSMRDQWTWNPVQKYAYSFHIRSKRPLTYRIRRYRTVKHLNFWVSFKPSKTEDGPPWLTFDDSWVDEVRRGLRACRVFCWYPLYCEFDSASRLCE
jgi:POT family proton-dependent oligopeptide transporter